MRDSFALESLTLAHNCSIFSANEWILHWNVPSAQKHSYKSTPSAQTPPFRHGFDWHSSSSTSQKAPPNPARQIMKNFSSHLSPRLSCFQRVFQAAVDSKCTSGWCRLSSLHHLMVFKKKPMSRWLIAWNKLCFRSASAHVRAVHPNNNGHTQTHGPLMRLLTKPQPQCDLTWRSSNEQKAYKKLYASILRLLFCTKECEKWIEISAQVRQSSLWWKQVLNYVPDNQKFEVLLVVDQLLERLRQEQEEFWKTTEKKPLFLMTFLDKYKITSSYQQGVRVCCGGGGSGLHGLEDRISQIALEKQSEESSHVRTQPS